MVATVSVTTVEFSAAGVGTRLVMTEQGTYLDGLEDPSWRERGTSQQLDALDTELKKADTPMSTPVSKPELQIRSS
jgi:hypothetical protein